MNRSTHATAAILLALSLAACGGDGEEAGGLETTATEYAFAPSTWTLEAGSEASITIDNEGAATHEWTVLADGRTIESEDELPEDEDVFLSEWVYTELEVEPGESETLEFTAPEAGTYQVICAIPGHFDQGMEATLVVE